MNNVLLGARGATDLPEHFLLNVPSKAAVPPDNNRGC
jgi:hypothetical protein